MNSFYRVLLGAAVALTITLNASALSITPSSPTPYKTFTSPSQSVIDQEIKDLFEPDVLQVYKKNVDDGSESGAFKDSYDTIFSNTPTDPSGATISYISGPAITAQDIYLLVKDGNQTPSAYLFDISKMWNGTDTISLTGFWPGPGAISHVSIYTRGAGVPDGGGTLILLGIALVGLAFAHRQRQIVKG